MPLCGAQTQRGAPCRRQVQREGEQCSLHRHAGNTCSICLTGLSGRTRTLPCNHTFHHNCIMGWRGSGHHTCPVCRELFDVPEFKITLIIEPRDGPRITSNINPQTITTILERLEMQISELENHMTELHFDVDNLQDLEMLLQDLNVPIPSDLRRPSTPDAE